MSENPNHAAPAAGEPAGASPRVVVVIPTYNEAENLPTLIGQLTALGIDGLGFLIVDDGSPDGTGEIADRLAASYAGYFKVMHRGFKQGLGRAYVAGFKRALADGAEVVVQMDADLSHPVAEVPAMIAKLKHADIVVGSRYSRGGGVDPGWRLGRRWLSHIGNAGIRALVGVPVRDATSGFKAFRRSALERIGLENLKSAGFGFQAEVAHAAMQAGLRTVEHPYVFMERARGKSKMSAAIVYEAIWRLLPMRFKRQ